MYLLMSRLMTSQWKVPKTLATKPKLLGFPHVPPMAGENSHRQEVLQPHQKSSGGASRIPRGGWHTMWVGYGWIWMDISRATNANSPEHVHSTGFVQLLSEDDSLMNLGCKQSKELVLVIISNQQLRILMGTASITELVLVVRCRYVCGGRSESARASTVGKPSFDHH